MCIRYNQKGINTTSKVVTLWNIALWCNAALEEKRGGGRVLENCFSLFNTIYLLGLEVTCIIAFTLPL